MSSVSQVKQAMQTVFRQADALARQTGFVQILVTAWLNNPQATREAVAHMAAILLDSTVIVLPDALAGVWRGCGGNTPVRTQAAVKLQVSLDLLWGALHGPHLSDGRAHDSSSTLQKSALNKKAFRLTDLGYFRLDVFAAHAQQEGYFLSRLEAATAVFNSEEQRLDLPTFLQARGPQMDLPVELGVHHHLPVRLLVVRVSAELANERRRKLRAEAGHKGQMESPARLALAEWTISVTNVPLHLLSVEEALILARARWQIELLFKLWKRAVADC